MPTPPRPRPSRLAALAITALLAAVAGCNQKDPSPSPYNAKAGLAAPE